MRSGIFSAFAFILGLATPVAAFDDLFRFAAALPATLATPFLFDYTAPLAGFGPVSPTQYGPSDTVLGAALFGPPGADDATGIDFSTIRGVLGFGDPPRTVTVLFGPPGLADGAPAALLARDFEQSEVAGFPVFARGEDYALDLTHAGDPDPLGSGMGKAQRLALGDDFLVRTAGWPEMDATLAALGGNSVDGPMWRAMLDGLAASAGPDSHLDIASGWAGSAFMDPGPELPATGKVKSRPAPLVLATFALLALTQDAERASVHIVIPYIDRDEAVVATGIIAERLILQPFTPHTPRIDIHAIEPHVVAVLSLDLPVADAAGARDIYASWMTDIYRRRFYPLMLGF